MSVGTKPSQSPSKLDYERAGLRIFLYIVLVASLPLTLFNPISGPICFTVALAGLAISARD